MKIRNYYYLSFLPVLIIIAFMPANLKAQSEKSEYKIISARIEYFYNQAKYDSIFYMFSPEMQEAIPLDTIRELLTGLDNQVGKITKRQFKKYVKDSFACYKTTFNRGVLALNISINSESKIDGLFLEQFEEDNLPIIERNKTKLVLPFSDEWTVFWGGYTKEQNYHIESKAQKNAFDFVIRNDKGKSFRTDGLNNEDYYAFGKEIFAPCDGEIVLAVEGVKDNKPGEFNLLYLAGNSVILKTVNNEYLFFAHFKHHSLKVNEGQKIKKGQILGLCGNSGRSSEPHLHFHIQNVEDIASATGVKCFFEELMVNGILKSDYSPVKGNRITRK